MTHVRKALYEKRLDGHEKQIRVIVDKLPDNGLLSLDVNKLKEREFYRIDLIEMPQQNEPVFAESEPPTPKD